MGLVDVHQLRLTNVPELWLVSLPSSEIPSERRARSRDGDSAPAFWGEERSSGAQTE